MEANVLRLILLITGVAFVLGIYFWERRKRDVARVHAVRREPEMSAPRHEEDEADSATDIDSDIDFDNAEEGVRLRPSRSQSPSMSQPQSSSTTQTESAGQSRSDNVHVPVWALKKSDSDALAHELGRLDAMVKEKSTPLWSDQEGEQIAFSFAADDKKKRPAEPPQPASPPKIIVINVAARHEPFAGESILQVAQDCGLEAGELDIFHHCDQAAGGKSLFSMASMVKPGSFPFDDMASFSTPGLSLFTQLPGPKDGLAMFNEMLTAAERLAQRLGGELQDETHSVLTRQTIEHLRSEITEYQRRQRVARKPA